MDSKNYILSKVKLKIREIDPKAKVILFGSRARDNHFEDSDWDFLILTRFSVTQDLRNRFSDSLFEAELETDSILTGIVQNIDSWKNYSGTPLFINISQDGVEI